MEGSFAKEVERRLPLASSVLHLLQFGLGDDILDGVFRKHSGRSYEDAIRFAPMVQLLTEGMFGQQRSAHETFLRAIDEDGVLVGSSIQAFYGKLRRVPIPLSLGLFDEVSSHLRTIQSPVVANPLPKSLESFWTLAFDGKKLKYVLKLLKPLRGLKGNVFGGKLMVAQDMATMQAISMHAVEDGEAGDNPMVINLVGRIRALPTDQPRLWVADRAFSEYTTLPLLGQDGDFFVVRYNARCKFHADPEAQTRNGVDSEGRPFIEQWGWLGAKKQVRCRKITVERKGRSSFSIITNLEDADLYPADDLLSLYRRRWGIETMFQQVCQTFNLGSLISSTPKGTIFQAALCFLVYNVTLMVRDQIAGAADKEPSKISTKKLFDDMADELSAMLTTLSLDEVLEVLREHPTSDAKSVEAHLKSRLSDVWRNRWNKAPTRKQPAERKPRAKLRGGHSSAYKIMRGEHKEILYKKPNTKCG